jgi:hypothetical protein
VIACVASQAIPPSTTKTPLLAPISDSLAALAVSSMTRRALPW